MATYTDQHIEYWGEIYLCAAVSERGVTFERFLARPHLYMSADAVRAAEAAAAERALSRAAPDARLRDGRLIEPLRHHAFYRGRCPHFTGGGRR